MKYHGTVSPVLLCLTVGVIAACSVIPRGTPQNAKSSTPSNSFSTMTPQPSESSSTEKEPDSPIRKLDFGNFVFPKLPSGKCSKQQIALVNGRYDAPEALVPRKIPSVDCWSVALGLINYGDVTGDGEEDAIITLYAELGGTEGAEDVYIYAFGVRRPKLLWKFVTGDRADGGLRRIYAENGKLVIELYGIGASIGKKLYGTEEVGACCPNHYTRTRYRWVGNHFQQVGKQEVFSNPSGSSEIVNPPLHIRTPAKALDRHSVIRVLSTRKLATTKLLGFLAVWVLRRNPCRADYTVESLLDDRQLLRRVWHRHAATGFYRVANRD